jgi:hypothetical protein
MGIAIEASMAAAGRALAELAAGAVGDDAHQDEDHAGDADQVRPVLVESSAVSVVMDGTNMDDDVGDPGCGHQDQAEQHYRRNPFQEADQLYR